MRDSQRLAVTRSVPALLTIAILAVMGCLASPVLAQAEAPAGDELPAVVGTIDGRALEREELLEEASSSLEQVDAQRSKCLVDADRQEHQALESALERLVRRRLFELEAERQGLSQDQVQDQLRAQAPEVSDEEVDAFYQENQARIQQPKEQIAGQIRTYLQQQRLQQAENEFFDQLKERYEVDYVLEPLRFEVADEGHPARGPATAPITIVEFSDFECPYCKRVLPTLEEVRETYGDQVRIVYRHYPLSSHPNAQKAAEASLCARDQGKFWEMHDLLFAEQGQLSVDDLKEKAARLGLDGELFDECLDSSRYFEAVQADLRAGSAAGVDGTPSLFVNGRFISGAVPFQTVAEVVNDELRRLKQED